MPREPVVYSCDQLRRGATSWSMPPGKWPGSAPAGSFSCDSITEEDNVTLSVYRTDVPDVDLLIRPGGEYRNIELSAVAMRVCRILVYEYTMA